MTPPVHPHGSALEDLTPQFPDPASARSDGLLMVGGLITADWLLAAYRQGIFPWPFYDAAGREIAAWFSPDPRAVLELPQFHASRRLLRRIRGGEFAWSFNRDFPAVVRACADRGDGTDTWITASLQRAYQDLHRAGVAHSLEVWHGQQLVGGIYGVALGAYFSAESMFHRRTDGSKAALYFLVETLRQRNFQLLDVQVWSEHLGSLGARGIPRRQFLERLQSALAAEVRRE
jgi:leucyl/phenylalanyl-tRNA---protein transferase